jgi:hypothetical protein
MKLPIMQFSQVSCHFPLLGYKYFTQHPTLKHPLLLFAPEVDTLSSAQVQSTGQITLQFIVIFIFCGTKTEDKLF